MAFVAIRFFLPGLFSGPLPHLALAQKTTEGSVVIASWYGGPFHGRCMADGRRYDKRQLTAAHKTLPLGTILEVTQGNRTVNVIITDRGPYIPGRDLDLSEKAAEMLGMKFDGIAFVSIRAIHVPNVSEKYHHQNISCMA